jgi:hypothetical protein
MNLLGQVRVWAQPKWANVGWPSLPSLVALDPFHLFFFFFPN